MTAILTIFFVAAASNSWPVDMSFTEVSRSSSIHPTLGYTEHQKTYLSPPMPLKPGQVVFTNPGKTPLKMPVTGSMVTGFTGEVVDDKGDSMPLTFVYDHHWIAIDSHHENDLCPGFENYVFGIGAESRNSPQRFPAGYGYPIAAGTAWGGNIHLLHTQNLSTVFSEGSLDLAAKQCNECYYAPGKGKECTPTRNGTFECCGDRCYDGSCSCPTTVAAHLLPATTFYLRYSVWYVEPEQASMLKDVRIGVWTTPNCAAFYQVLRNDKKPEQLSRTSFTIPHAGTIIHAVGHQHTGAINISMWHNDRFVCASYPSYGNQTDVPGNERGHLVKMSTCMDKDTSGYVVNTKKGDTIRLDAYYWVGGEDRRIAPSPAGTHLNVMSYMYVVFDIGQEELEREPSREEKRLRLAAAGAGCTTALVEPCGAFIGTGDACIDCAAGAVRELAHANCSVAHVEDTCQGRVTASSTLAKALPPMVAPYMW